jgi:diguanylate cyclase (GGDEF)-like protein
MYITDDVRDLPQDDRKILEAQNIKSLAILSLVYHENPIGYIGFDDCNHYRVWRKDEIALLRNVSSIIVSLMVRRESESKVLRTIDILHKITDSLNYIIYVSDLQTNELLFTNQALRRVCLPDGRALEGEKCWQALRRGEDGVCPFCPLRKMIDEHGNIIMDEYAWEFQNRVTGRWYLANDSIIEWIDGRMVHMETALEITNRKEYEERLERYASTDMMTGLLNRITGYQIIQSVLDDTAENAGEVMSLIFIDVDGLKNVNDTYGHDAGDDVILSLADSLRGQVRKEDMVCRWGGDEFLVMLQCGRQVATQKMHAVEEDIFIKNSLNRTPYKLAVSYGITEFVAGSGNSIDDIVSAADKKMYDAKTNKK